MSAERPRQYKNYAWIVCDPELPGGRLAIRGTRFSVSFILSCLAEQMTLEEIEETRAPLPREAIPKVLRAASELLDSPHVAA